MADSSYGFRSSMGGFHKGDVAAYIEKTAIAHRTEILEYEKEIAKLREENFSLQQQLNLLMMATPLPTTAAPATEPEPIPEPAPTPAPVPQFIDEPLPINDSELMQMELQAYRRAEAVERKASNRARNLYQQMEGMCESALDEFQLTDAAVKNTIQVMMQQASSLEQAYQTLAAALNTSREKLAAMNKLLDEEV